MILLQSDRIQFSVWYFWPSFWGWMTKLCMHTNSLRKGEKSVLSRAFRRHISDWLMTLKCKMQINIVKQYWHTKRALKKGDQIKNCKDSTSWKAAADAGNGTTVSFQASIICAYKSFFFPILLCIELWSSQVYLFGKTFISKIYGKTQDGPIYPLSRLAASVLVTISTVSFFLPLHFNVISHVHLKRVSFYFFQSCWPTRCHIERSTRISNPAWHLPQVVPRVDQTTGSVHPSLHCPIASSASTQSQPPV